jgi:RimJ/RimL family protein N-acetyltransferase
VSVFTTLETERLRLRRLRDDDVEALVAYRSLPEVYRYLPREGYDAHAARSLIDEMRDREPGQVGTWFQVAVTERGSDVFIGDVGLRTDATQPHTFEVGYTFSPAHHGRGYATEAVRAVLGFAFESLGAHRVFGNCDARNIPSARVLERVGMRREAHHVEDWWSKGEWTSSFIYAVLAREWSSTR